MEIKKHWIIFLILIVIVLVVFRQVFLNNRIPFSSNLLVSLFQPWFSQYGSTVPNKAIGWDNLRIFYPQRVFAQNLLSNFKIPFWNPYNFSGNVHLGNSQTATFYPLNILYFIFSSINTWTILVILGFLMTGYFTYLFVNSLLDNKKAALLSTFAFMFSGPLMVRVEDGLVIMHSILWLPLVLYGIEMFFKLKKKKYLFLAYLGIFSSITSGWFQFTFYLLALSFVYSFYKLLKTKWIKNNIKSLLIFKLFWIFTLGSTAFHFLPSVQALFLSPRGGGAPQHFIDQFLLGREGWFTLIAPDFFGNPTTYNYFGSSFYKERVLFISIVPLFFALFQMFDNFFKNKRLSLWAYISIFCFLLGFRNPLSIVLLKSEIPVISSFVPSRIFIVSSFSLSVLAGYGLKNFLNWLKNAKKASWLSLSLTSALFIFFFLSILAVFYPQVPLNVYDELRSVGENNLNTALRNTILPFASFLTALGLIGIGLSFKKKVTKFIWLSITLIPLLFGIYYADKYLYFSERKFVFPQHPVWEQLQKYKNDHYRFWSYGKGHVESNFSTYYQVYSPEGVDAMYPRWYAQLFSGCKTEGKFTEEVMRIEAEVCGADSFYESENHYQQRLLDLLSVKYITKLTNKKVLENASLLWENDKWQIWERQNIQPRAYLVSDYVLAANEKDSLEKTYSQKLDLNKQIVLQKDPQIEKNGQSIKKAEIIEYKPNKVKIKSQAEKEALLYLSDTYYPEWEAFVDNKKTEVLKANHAFRAIVVPEGNHEVVFKYTGKAFKKGLVISFVSIIGLTILFIKKDFTNEKKD